MIRELAIDQLFAKDFLVKSKLGEGGMGAVYEVEQVSLGARRALKIMHADLAADPKLRARFEQEARIGATIPSDHIVQVVAAGVDESTGTPFLAMEMLEGESLAARAERSGRLELGVVAEIYEQLGHALGEAHAKGIVHRDLKPENIFLARARRSRVAFTVKVLDFGIAKALAEAKTKATAAMGTPLWMAPEQTASKAGVTPATDVWALGLIAYRLLAGAHFWRATEEDSNPMQLMREVVFDPLPTASERAAESQHGPLPEGFDAWFGRCVAREPSVRFPTGGEACEALAELLRNSAGEPAKLATQPTAAVRAERPLGTVAAAPLPSSLGSSPASSKASSPEARTEARGPSEAAFAPQMERAASTNGALATGSPPEASSTRRSTVWLALGAAAAAASALVYLLVFRNINHGTEASSSANATGLAPSGIALSRSAPPPTNTDAPIATNAAPPPSPSATTAEPLGPGSLPRVPLPATAKPSQPQAASEPTPPPPDNRAECAQVANEARMHSQEAQLSANQARSQAQSAQQAAAQAAAAGCPAAAQLVQAASAAARSASVEAEAASENAKAAVSDADKAAASSDLQQCTIASQQAQQSEQSAHQHAQSAQQNAHEAHSDAQSAMAACR